MLQAKLNGLPISIPVDIRINRNHPEMDENLKKFLAELEKLVIRLGGKWEITHPSDRFSPQVGKNFLDVLLCDGVNPTEPDSITLEILNEQHKSAWVLPMMPRAVIKTGPPTLTPPLNKQNIAFWDTSVEEMAATILARAGVTTLDRRVFISYRRTETQPMADQLFDALTRLNFSVFLDTVSINPGEDFQARLFEQLADKSMIVLLHSPDFSNSQWCMEEVKFARKYELGLQILRLPGASPKDLIYQYVSASNVVALKESNLSDYSPGYQFKLENQELERLVKFIMLIHDASMVRRLQLIRNKIDHAIQSAKLLPIYSENGAYISTNINGKSYSLFPSPRPPGLKELFDAGSRTTEDVGSKRIVIGQTANMHSTRKQQLDWAVNGSPVTYENIFNLTDLLNDMKEGKR